jgi:2-dehydropantoate 2-reductase
MERMNKEQLDKEQRDKEQLDKQQRGKEQMNKEQLDNDNRYEINTVAIIGLGALGILFGHHLSKRMPAPSLRIVANADRIRRYEAENVYCNGEQSEFHYVLPEDSCEPADLVLFTVKYQGLQEAIKMAGNQIGENTIILSALNGITSEEIIGKVYGMEKLLYCVAQGMDAVKEANQLTYAHMGMLVFGDKDNTISPKTQAVAKFFEQMQVPYKIDSDMKKRMWGKFMLNVGVNQTVAVMEGNYGDIQKEGSDRERMIAAMREVMLLSNQEGVNLTKEDLNYWLGVLATLSPEGKPSMRQDMEARRYSEVELFAGAVLELGRKYKIETPVNQDLYDSIIKVERTYK